MKDQVLRDLTLLNSKILRSRDDDSIESFTKQFITLFNDNNDLLIPLVRSAFYRMTCSSGPFTNADIGVISKSCQDGAFQVFVNNRIVTLDLMDQYNLNILTEAQVVV